MSVAAGDSGYPLEPWLLTPLTAPTTRQENAFNSAHSKTRNVIERCFGVLKSRFRCLDKSGGTLLYTADKACKLVTATAVLHNFCITQQLNADVDPSVMDRSTAIQPVTDNTALQQPASVSATRLRQTVVQQF